MLVKQSLESQAYQILMWHASALFSNFLWVKLQRQRRPMSPFHLYNNRVQRQNPLPNYPFHQIQDKFKKLGRVLFCTGTVFCSCISMSSTSSNGILGEDSKHQRLPGAKHWAVHVGTLEFQYHLSRPWKEALLSANRFCRVPSWRTRRNPLWAGQNACEMVRKREEDEKSNVEQLQNQLVF